MSELKVEKAYAISDAKIQFVSLVDKAANRREFLIAKADNVFSASPENTSEEVVSECNSGNNIGEAQFMTNGRIIKADKAMHYVTGVVYEPMTRDSQNNYMTEEEIVKAAYWFNKNGTGNDIQHNYEKCEGARVVESYVTKSDTEIEGQKIKKGSWIMTVEVGEDIFDKVQKGELTGFSMGGVGKYSTVDIDIGEINKSEEVKGLVGRLAGLLGLNKSESVEKAGKKISASRLNKLKEMQSSLNEILSEAETEKEDIKMTSEQITEAVKKAMEPLNERLEKIEKGIKAEEKPDKLEEKGGNVVEISLSETIEKAVKPFADKLEGIEKTVEEIAKARNLPTNLNDEGEKVEKTERHYMEDIFGF